MASTYSPNLSVELPGSGDYVGTWNSPLNSDLDIFDQAIGTHQIVDLSGGSVTLSTAQTRSAQWKFYGALPSNVTVTIPGLSSAPGTTISGKSWIVQSQCTNSSLYTITLQTTVAGQQAICVPPYEPTTVFVEGTNSSQAGSIKYANLGRVGTLWDYIGSSVPNWVTGCTVPPYLNCDGTTFSSATYPALATILGSTTLPDTRGRFRATLNQGQSRITSGSSTGGVDGNTNFASGGSQTTTLSSQNVPDVPITDPGHSHGITSTNAFNYSITAAVGTIVFNTVTNKGSTSATQTSSFGVTQYANTSITAGSTSPTNFSNIPPAVIIGLTLIRSA